MTGRLLNLFESVFWRLASGVASGAKLPVGHDEIYFHPDSVSFTRDQPRQGPNPSFMRYGHGSVVAM
ncbi:MAG: hypothetical protein ACPIFQ_06370 [Candidatus Puniceispirillaceae bacterium]|jgi:hypothetical protein